MDTEALTGDGLAQTAAAPDTAALEEVRVRLLGRRAELTLALRELGNLPAEQRGARGKVLNEARRCAEVIARNGPLAVQAVKRSVLAGLGRPTSEALDLEQAIGIPVSMSHDAKEGTRAFKEKRPAVFQGH